MAFRPQTNTSILLLSGFSSGKISPFSRLARHSQPTLVVPNSGYDRSPDTWTIGQTPTEEIKFRID